MAKQTFTSGQVLTATQVNNLQANDYNWSTNAQTANYVLVAADAGKTVTMTNAAATTITVNTSLFAAGDTVRIMNLGAGTTTITAGTATVNSASSLALSQYQSGTLWFSSTSASIFSPDDRTVTSGLTLIKTQTIGSGVSSVNVTGAFSSTYDNYRIILSGGSSSATVTLRWTLGATATGYYYGSRYVDYAGTTGVINGANAAYIAAGSGTSDGLTCIMDILSPNLADQTAFSWSYADILTNGSSVTGSGYLNNTTQYTDFTFVGSSGTLTGGTVRVYGYQNS